MRAEPPRAFRPAGLSSGFPPGAPPLFSFSPAKNAALALSFFGVKVSKEQAAPFARGGGKFDFLGTIALTFGLGGLILFISTGANLLPFFSFASNVLLAVTVVALAVAAVFGGLVCVSALFLQKAEPEA